MSKLYRSSVIVGSVAFFAGVLIVIAFLMAANAGLVGLPSQANENGNVYALKDAPSSSPDEGNGVSVQSHALPGVSVNTIPDIVTKASPTVVKIDTIATTRGGRQVDPFFGDPFFKEFFGDGFFSEPQVKRGLGSGFIVSKDGYILTNEHVIDGVDKIEVTVAGYGKPLGAKLVGVDYDLDLAVLKIEAGKNLPTLMLGNSDKVRVGDWVIAIGNPYGLDHTVTVGVVSAKSRPISVQDRRYENLLQTDASINPGNSGGPLLNLRGEVIGINTAINAQAQGIGFAIPSNTVNAVFEQLVKGKGMNNPWLGVQLQPLTNELAHYFGLSKAEGALVALVVEGSPADKAGLSQGDIIIQYNKKKIKTCEDLVNEVKKTRVGQKVALLVLRNGSTRYVTVTVGSKISRS